MKKNKLPKSWSNHNLPPELWPEILYNLPAKSLLKFRTVSKSWQAIIDDPEFARLHLTQFKNNLSETHLLVSKRKYGRLECVVKRSQNYSVSARFGYLQSSRDGTFRNLPAFRDCPVKNWEVHSSVDGLVMLKQLTLSIEVHIRTLMLWNPSIRKARIIPPSPQIPYTHRNYDSGLVFDPSIKDYKNFRFQTYYINTENTVGVYVYTVGSNSWKTIQLHGKGYDWLHQLYPQSSIYLKGVLYLIAHNVESLTKSLVSFYFSTEVFARTGFPYLPVDGNPSARMSYMALTLVDGGCSLAIYGFYNVVNVNQGSLWVVESFGTDIMSMTWTKRYTFFSPIPAPCYHGRLLCLRKNGDMFFDGRKFVTCYNPETQDERIVPGGANGLSFTSTIHAYIESLILLN